MRTAAVNPDGPTSDSENAGPITQYQIPVADAEPRLEPRRGPLTGPNPPRTGSDAPPTWI
jgi:hypothetical protein